MSNSSLSEHAPVLGDVDGSSVVDTLTTRLTGLAFWTAVALPFLYLPLLVTGLDSAGTLTAFVFLIGLNVVTLVVGHPYASE